MKHERYLRRCFELASKGLGRTESNPLVGSVIVYQDKIIGEGYHASYGGPHAEVNAINSVSNKELLKESTIYVNLEPCCHFGKTPPCADLIIQSGIKKVVISNTDPFIDVNGGGIKRLKENGVEVSAGILEEEGKNLNRRFFTFHLKKRPYIILKWAQSQDGFMDVDRDKDAKGINWITNKRTKNLTHFWRSQEMGILVGANTVRVDNPELTVREVKGRNPHRFLIDPNLIASEDSKIFNDQAPITVFNLVEEKKHEKINYIKIDPSENILNAIMESMHATNVNSLIVEGGATTLNKFIEAGLWDEARVLTGKAFFKSGLKAPVINGIVHCDTNFSGDRVQIINR